MRRQMAMVEDAEAEAEAGGIEWVVADPLPLMTALYSIVYFSDDSLWEVSMQDARRYDLILWCQPDVPWTPEPGMRDGELHRLAAHEVIAERAAVLLPLRLISGTADIRVAGALGYAAEIDAATRPGA